MMAVIHVHIASYFPFSPSFQRALISEHTWPLSEVNCRALPAITGLSHAGHTCTTEADMLVSFSLTHKKGTAALGYV